MTVYYRENHSVNDFIRWRKEGELILRPKFQRRPVWQYPARSYLVDTVVRGLPMPKIFLRRVVSETTKLKAYEVVDGQQRLQAILDFHAGSLKLSRDQNQELGGVSFEGLPEPAQRSFLEYEISTEVMEDANDSEVYGMFERLNRYTLALNPQERLNAKYFGPFKQTVYKLAADQTSLDAWKKLKAFTDRQVSRMSEVEHTSDVLVAIVEGISDITAMRAAYERYDKQFPKQEGATKSFHAALQYVLTLSGAVNKTRFRQRSWFYSLMVAAADSISGIPNGLGPLKPRPCSEVTSRMCQIDEALKMPIVPGGLAKLQKSFSGQTSHVPPRQTRHEYFFEMLTLSQSKWDARWKNLSEGMTMIQNRI